MMNVPVLFVSAIFLICLSILSEASTQQRHTSDGGAMSSQTGSTAIHGGSMANHMGGNGMSSGVAGRYTMTGGNMGKGGGMLGQSNGGGIGDRRMSGRGMQFRRMNGGGMESAMNGYDMRGGAMNGGGMGGGPMGPPSGSMGGPQSGPMEPGMGFGQMNMGPMDNQMQQDGRMYYPMRSSALTSSMSNSNEGMETGYKFGISSRMGGLDSQYTRNMYFQP